MMMILAIRENVSSEWSKSVDNLPCPNAIRPPSLFRCGGRSCTPTRFVNNTRRGGLPIYSSCQNTVDEGGPGLSLWHARVWRDAGRRLRSICTVMPCTGHRKNCTNRWVTNPIHHHHHHQRQQLYHVLLQTIPGYPTAKSADLPSILSRVSRCSTCAKSCSRILAHNMGILCWFLDRKRGEKKTYYLHNMNYLLQSLKFYDISNSKNFIDQNTGDDFKKYFYGTVVYHYISTYSRGVECVGGRIRSSVGQIRIYDRPYSSRRCPGGRVSTSVPSCPLVVRCQRN